MKSTVPETYGNVLIIDNLRSSYNVGAIFRTADAIGISHIYLVGTTPTPIGKFNKVNGEIAKTALGGELNVPWSYSKTTAVLIKKLKKQNFVIVSLEQDKKSIDYKKLKKLEKIALVVGNEVDGVNKSILKNSDYIIEIPMNGKKESLNVSVATGIVLYRIFDK